MTKEEWKDLMLTEEVIFINQSTKKNKEILNKIGEEKVIDKIAEMFSVVKGLRLHYNDSPIGDFMITEGEFEGEHNRLYLKATSMEIAQRRANLLKKAGYKADSAYELYVPWTRVYNIVRGK